MATPQELQNALMLKKTQGLTTEQAVNQARVPITATSQINQDRLAQNQASRQGTPTTVLPTALVTPTAPTTTPNGASLGAEGTITPAPISPIQTEQDLNNQLGGVIQPNGLNSVQPLNAKTTMPAEPIKPITPTKIEPVIDYTQAKGREAEIQANLDSFKAKGMTPDEIMRASDYQNASPEKKALIEPYLKQQVPTASAMYNNIVAKADIPDEQKTSLPYKIANNRYMKANSFSTMTPSQLSNEMTNSRFIQGSQAYEDLKAMNPKLVQDTENLRIVNGSKQNVFTYVNNPDGTTTKTNNLEKTFAQDYIDNFQDAIKQMFAVQTPEQIRAIINTPDVIAAQDKATQIELGMNELEKQIENVDDDVETEMKGSGATGSRIALEKASRKEKLEKEYNSQLKNYTTYANKANNLITQNTSLYTTSQAQQAQQANAMLPILQDQYKTEQAKAQAQQALNDPQTQIEQTIAEFAKMGITAQGNTASKIAEFQKSGKTLPDYISGLRAQFMSKPEYKKIQELQQGQMSDAQKMQATQAFQAQSDIRNFSQQKELARYNNDLNRQEFLFKIENDPAQRAKTAELESQLNSNKSLFDVLGKNVGTYEGNRGYDLAGALGDPLPAGGNWTVKSIDTAGEQVGSIFIGGKGKKPYGNTVVMQDENGNEIRYSHLQNIGVKAGDTLGFGDIVGTRGNTGNVMGANGEKLTPEQLKAGRGAHLDVEIKSGGKLLSNADQVTFLKGLKSGGSATNPSALPLYRAYMEDNKLPSKDALAGLGMSSEQFTNNASTGYNQFLKSKENEINSTYPTLQIEFTPSYASLSATQREKLNESMTKIGDIDMRLEKLKKLFNDNGTEVLPTQAKKEMQSLKQQIILKAKEVENLGVLNGPDLGILESLIPETTGVMSGLFSFDDNTNTTLNSIQSNYRSDAKTKGINYGARISFKDQANTAPISTNTAQVSPEAQSIENEWINRKP